MESSIGWPVHRRRGAWPMVPGTMSDAELEDRLHGSGLWEEPRAHLSDEELVALFKELSEDSFVEQLRKTAAAARTAADAYQRRAERLSSLADQLDARSEDEEKRLAEERGKEGRLGSGSIGSLVIDPDTVPTLQDSERRW